MKILEEYELLVEKFREELEDEWELIALERVWPLEYHLIKKEPPMFSENKSDVPTEIVVKKSRECIVSVIGSIEMDDKELMKLVRKCAGMMDMLMQGYAEERCSL